MAFYCYCRICVRLLVVVYFCYAVSAGILGLESCEKERDNVVVAVVPVPGRRRSPLKSSFMVIIG